MLITRRHFFKSSDIWNRLQSLTDYYKQRNKQIFKTRILQDKKNNKFTEDKDEKVLLIQRFPR